MHLLFFFFSRDFFHSFFFCTTVTNETPFYQECFFMNDKVYIHIRAVIMKQRHVSCRTLSVKFSRPKKRRFKRQCVCVIQLTSYSLTENP